MECLLDARNWHMCSISILPVILWVTDSHFFTDESTEPPRAQPGFRGTSDFLLTWGSLSPQLFFHQEEPLTWFSAKGWRLPPPGDLLFLLQRNFACFPHRHLYDQSCPAVCSWIFTLKPAYPAPPGKRPLPLSPVTCRTRSVSSLGWYLCFPWCMSLCFTSKRMYLFK